MARALDPRGRSLFPPPPRLKPAHVPRRRRLDSILTPFRARRHVVVAMKKIVACIVLNLKFESFDSLSVRCTFSRSAPP